MKQYNLTEQQTAVIAVQINEVGKQLILINFQDPALDHQTIRHHAYLSGKFAVLKALLEDDFPETASKPEGE
jgi:hypothetical protein